MEVFSSVADIRAARWAAPDATWGLVPTMGFLHEGHLSLVHRARQENEKVGVSIFVNPAQFDRPNDLQSYPRNLKRDLRFLADAKVDLIWEPQMDDVYPERYQTQVQVVELTQPLEGKARPGHFDGVTTIVTKLLNVFQPNRVYFGQKDAQQAVVIRRMVQDLGFNVTVVTCATVRESDGLAMSSRNAHLTPEQRKQAVCLHEALSAGQQLFEQGETDAKDLRQAMLEKIEAYSLASVDYVSVADPETLEELQNVSKKALFSVAVFFNEVRLIDNFYLSRD